MNRTRTSSAALSIAGLIAILAIAWGLDALMAYLGRYNARTFTLLLVFPWIHTFNYFLLAALLLLLFWFVVERAPRNAWIAALYLLVGSFFGSFLVLYYLPAIGSWMPPVFDMPLLSATFYTILSGSFIALIGLFALILPRR